MVLTKDDMFDVIITMFKDNGDFADVLKLQFERVLNLKEMVMEHINRLDLNYNMHVSVGSRGVVLKQWLVLRGGETKAP